MTSTHSVSWWRVTRNILSLGLRELSNKGTYLLLGILIARVMGREAFGAYTLSLLLSRGFFTIGDLGFGTWLVREVSQAPRSAGRFFGTIGLYRLLSGVAILGLIGGFLVFSRYDPSLKHFILLCAVAFFFIHLMSFIFSFFRAFERMESEFYVSVVKNILFIGGGLWAIFQRSLDLLFWVFIAASFAALLFSLWIYGRRIGWNGIRWEPMPLKGVFSIWLIQSAVMVYLYLGAILLSFFRGLDEVGLYQAAYSFIEMILILSTLLTVALFPVFSRLAKRSFKELLAFYEEAFRGVLFFFVPFGILALLGGRTLLLTFYGDAFRAALPALTLLLAGFVFFLVGGLNGHLLIAAGKERWVLAAVTVCTALNLSLNLLWIPRHGFLGASGAMVLSETVMFSLMVGWIARTFGSVSFLKGRFFWGLVLVWGSLLFGLSRLPFLLWVCIGLGSYLLLSVFFRQKLVKEMRAAKVLWGEFKRSS